MHKILSTIVPFLVWFYLHLVQKTSKVIWVDHELENALQREKKPYIYAFWHGRQLFLAVAYGNKNHCMLVSKSKDGEYIANTLAILGIQPVRGSSSRGGARAIIELKREMARGRCVGFTPDGPRGPQRHVAPGVLFLAQKTQSVILPITYSCKRKLTFHSWDEFWVPLPFNRVVVQFGNHIRMEANDCLDKKSADLAGELNRITGEADQAARV